MREAGCSVRNENLRAAFTRQLRGPATLSVLYWKSELASWNKWRLWNLKTVKNSASTWTRMSHVEIKINHCVFSSLWFPQSLPRAGLIWGKKAVGQNGTWAASSSWGTLWPRGLTVPGPYPLGSSCPFWHHRPCINQLHCPTQKPFILKSTVTQTECFFNSPQHPAVDKH